MTSRITFEILNERFTLQSDVEERYFLGIVDNLKDRIESIQERFPSLSNLKAVILAAVDILDELEKSRKHTLKDDEVELLESLSRSLASAMNEGESTTKGP